MESTALDCTSAGAWVTVNLGDGEAAVCTFTNGQLPCTGMLPFLIAGLWSVLMGLGLVLWSSMKRTRA